MGTRRRRVSVIYFISKLVKWDDLRMEIISNPSQVEIKKAAQAIKDGHLVAFPTETVYGLGADATNEKAVSRVYSVKGRPADHPVIVHIPSIESLEIWAMEIPTYALKLANEFWPGPMTLILKRSNFVQDYITGGQEKVGVRVPSNPIALKLLEEFKTIGGTGIAAPSANRFGAVSPTTANAVEVELGFFLSPDDLILDGGQSSIGVESTIIDCTYFPPSILRPGAITFKMIEMVVGTIADSKVNATKAPGLFKSHYAPKAIVKLGKYAVPGDGFLALESVPTPLGAYRLATPVNVDEYAKTLYSALRLADELGIKTVIALPPEGAGLAEAIRDRLNKASNG
jgi:L-threonylcarbamoyladenylate synthase